MIKMLIETYQHLYLKPLKKQPVLYVLCKLAPLASRRLYVHISLCICVFVRRTALH